jgi:hypothetical protein
MDGELSSGGTGGELFLSVEVVVDAVARELVWQLPPEAIPRSRLELREDDPSLRAYLEIRPKAPGSGSATPPGPF